MSTGRPKAVIRILLRFFDVAVLIGEPFFRLIVASIAFPLTRRTIHLPYVTFPHAISELIVCLYLS